MRGFKEWMCLPAMIPGFTGCYEASLEPCFVTRARLQPGRNRRKISEGFSPAMARSKKLRRREFRSSLSSR